VGGVAALMEGAPDLEIIPTVIDGSWKVFLNNMLPVPFGTQVRVAFGEPIRRSPDEDPQVVLEQCRKWAAETLTRWNEESETTA
jgi:1-acyl-sn-glycerol-3-phosphate acyltransferase